MGSRVGPDQFGDGPSHRPQPGLHLEGAVLAVAEPDRKPGVGVVGGIDVRDRRSGPAGS